MLDSIETAAQILLALGIAAILPETYRSMRRYGKRGKFRCTMCGNCCRFRITPLTKDDVSRLENAGYSGFSDYKGELCMKRINGKCFFLKDDRCTVHEHRPRVCRDFPFFRELGIGYAKPNSFCPAQEELEHG
jgi:Fe-S-cluster containining protein